LPILILAVCDPLAALFGKKYPFGKYKNGNGHKTMMGSFVFFTACFLIVSVSFYFKEVAFTNLLLTSFIISIIATLTEPFSRNGTDNLCIPVVVVVVALLLFNSSC
jgi:dolichol kinase